MLFSCNQLRSITCVLDSEGEIYLKLKHVPENGPAVFDPVRTTTLILGSAETTLSAPMRASIVFWDKAFRLSGLLIFTMNE